MDTYVMDSVIAQRSDKLTTPDDFTFPFQPYGIQLEFMRHLYCAIEEGKIGIFESPTGTGKSLSIICAALSWLRDHEEREIKNLDVALNNIKPNNEKSGDWLEVQIKARAIDATILELRNQLDRINSRNAKIKSMRLRGECQRQQKNTKWIEPSVNPKVRNFEDEGDENKNEEEVDDILEEFSDDLNDSDSKSEEPDDEKEELPATRIIYCSRTHSQLSQFVNELNKTSFSSNARLVHLASRQNYCINKKVKTITNAALINEKCLELQNVKESNTTLKDIEGVSVKKQKAGGGTRCPHLKGVSQFSEIILSQVMDMEAVNQAGNKNGTCPYYSTRAIIPLVEIIVLPYHTLLHKGSREASGLKLDNSVVIIDEAHNLLETVSHIHSCQISGQQLTFAHSQLCQYRDKYLNKFSPANLLYLSQLIHVINVLLKLIRVKKEITASKILGEESSTQLFKVVDFVMTAEIDNYNLYKLLAFCKKSKISHKLQRFSDNSASFIKIDSKTKSSATGIKDFLQGIKHKNPPKKSNLEKNEPITEPSNNLLDKEDLISQPLPQITAFLSCLTQEYSDGRVVVSRESSIGKSCIKYLLLEPATTIVDVVNKARCVILAGGTMEPISEFKERLFNVCGIPESRIVHFSCGHIIPKENILPIIVGTGPTGKQFDFSFPSRSSEGMMNEIGRLLINVCNVVPSGVVCFFPSYDYEKDVYEYFERNGIIKNISTKKKVFREPKKSHEVDKVLSSYAEVIEKSKENSKINGALLFSVVGGKLSEGLNFSDDLGRCVIVIGMPFPNMKSPELQEKMNYLEEHFGPNAGKLHCENLCMKAVNQSVGRSIRHLNDYSSVLLVDQRYSRPNIHKLLPKWMQESLRIEREKFGPVLARLCKFFKFHGGNIK